MDFEISFTITRHFSYMNKSHSFKNLNLKKKPIATFAAFSGKTISGT